MSESFTVATERIDDLPLLLSQLKRMGIPALLDHHFPVHGNWQGLSLGWVVTVWLCHILSEGDHCLEHVRPWASKRLHSLRVLVAANLEELDFTDDRLANILTIFSNIGAWREFEKSLCGELLSVYDLEARCIRHDSTTSSSFRCVSALCDLFQFGHSKDYRPDLAQLKVMLASLDPMGLPLVTEVLPGNQADDPLYISSIQRVQEDLQKRNLLHVGDSKMSSLSTRSYLVFSGDSYLMPLSLKQLSRQKREESIAAALANKEQWQEVYQSDGKGQNQLIAQGFEVEEIITTSHEDSEFSWKERRFFVHSAQHAKRLQAKLLRRIEKTQEQLEQLNERGRGKPRPKNRTDLEQAIKKIITEGKVEEFLEVNIEEKVTEKKVRAYKQRPATLRQEWDFQINVFENQDKIEETLRYLGWQIYATPLLRHEFSFQEAVVCYRNEYRIEHNFRRLKGPLSLKPMYLQKEDRIEGLIRLLTIALRVLSLTEFKVRETLKKKQEALQGLYPANPKRVTQRPTTEKLLKAFDEVNLTIIRQAKQTLIYLNDLSPLQSNILQLMGLSQDCYYQLRENFINST